MVKRPDSRIAANLKKDDFPGKNAKKLRERIESVSLAGKL